MSFAFSTTTDEVLEGIDLTGTVAVVTGASGGLGLETSRALAAHGAHVVMAARDADKNLGAVASIVQQHPGADVTPMTLDLASLASVRQFATDVLDRYDQIQLLVNNAGVMCTPFGHTADGFELQFGTNHLGHFLLTNLLVPALIAGAPSRVISVSSAGHAMGNIDFDDPNFAHRPYGGWESYGQSKTANILFARELDRRLASKGVRAYSVHPGGIQTELGRYMTPEDIKWLMDRIASSPGGGSFEFKSIPQGAATQVWAATSSSLDGQGGIYLEDCQLAQPMGEGSGRGYTPYAADDAAAERLWTMSEGFVGQTFS